MESCPKLPLSAHPRPPFRDFVSSYTASSEGLPYLSISQKISRFAFFRRLILGNCIPHAEVTGDVLTDLALGPMEAPIGLALSFGIVRRQGALFMAGGSAPPAP